MIFARKHPGDPRKELAARELAARHLLHFTTYTHRHYIPEDFHIYVTNILQSLITSEIQRKVMIFAPPQHGKSELVSVRFPPFWLAHRPYDPVLVCSYGALLAQNKVAQSRSIMASRSYRNIFTNLFEKELKENKLNYVVKTMGRRIAGAGVGGSITGFGAGLGIIDDPVRSWADAQSSSYRNKVWEWYRGTFRTRIWEHGHIVLIMTRWHEEDLAGKLLDDQPGEWEVYRFPAISETDKERKAAAKIIGIPSIASQGDLIERKENEPLCPIRFPLRSLQKLRRDVGAMPWAAEYQALPRALEGNLIQYDWLKSIDFSNLPNRMTLIRYWDKAATEGGGAYTCGLLMGRDGYNYYIIDVVRGQWSTYKRERVMLKTAKQDKHTWGHVRIYVELEGGSGGIDSYEQTARTLHGFPIRSDKPSKSKLLRLDPFASNAEAGNISIVKAPWNDAFITELITVPNNAYWDQVDSASGAFNILVKSGLNWKNVEDLGTIENFQSRWD